MVEPLRKGDGASADLVQTAEVAMVGAFVVPHRRHRYLQLLETKKGRDRVRRQLAHMHDLDPRFASRIHESSAGGIARILRQRGAPADCYVFSESSMIDATKLPLDDALVRIVGQGFGTLLSCIPGKLAFYEGEEPHERYILSRG